MADKIICTMQDLDTIIDAQCMDGNWNYSPYMHGLANGLILAKCLLDGSDPEFKSPPDSYLENMEESFIAVEETND